MRSIITFIGIILAFPWIVKAQSKNGTELIGQAILDYRDSITIYYIDSSFVYSTKFSDFSSKGVVKGFADIRKPEQVSIKFTKSELQYIDSQFNHTKTIQWEENLFPNSVRIKQDSIPSFLQYMNTPEFKKNRKIKYYYHFSVPVFLRNNTLAIFRVAEWINYSGGTDFLFIYSKEREVWKRYLTIWGGSW